jgi:hypothetical protein
MKHLVTDFCSLDIRRLKREGYLAPNLRSDWTWRTPHGEEQASVTLTALHKVLQIEYTVPEKDNRYICVIVPLWFTIGSWGAERRWFGCPRCRGRVAILYFTTGLFQCRRCANLAYPSQYASTGRSYGRRCRYLSRFKQTQYAEIDQY